MSYCKVSGCRFSNSHVTSGHKCGTCGQFGHGQIECKNKFLKEKLKQYLDDKLPEYLQCKILNCKYKWSHTVAAHTCRNCGEREHDKLDCPKLSVNIKCPLCKVQNIVTKEMLQKSYQFLSNNDCCICLEKKADVYFQSCHHVCICSECCQRLNPFPTDLNISDRIVSESELPSDIIQKAKTIFNNSSHIIRPYCYIYAGMGCCWYIRKNNSTIQAFFLHNDNHGQYGPESDDTPIVEQFISGYTNVNPDYEMVV